MPSAVTSRLLLRLAPQSSEVATKLLQHVHSTLLDWRDWRHTEEVSRFLGPVSIRLGQRLELGTMTIRLNRRGVKVPVPSEHGQALRQVIERDMAPLTHNLQDGMRARVTEQVYRYICEARKRGWTTPPTTTPPGFPEAPVTRRVERMDAP